ncbi:MAG: sigma-70 family RNA polymerase sigma factor [Bacteroidales bacterium]|nr:sigma-70 family RNA polymerase sigma factor [Bacteroidales bacterium]
MKTHYPTDLELINQYLEGEYSCLEELINRHRSRIFTYIFLMVKDNHLAEDIFQDTFIKVIKSLHAGKYHEDGRFISWVMRIAHNLIIDHFRKKKRMSILHSDDYSNQFLFDSCNSSLNVEEDSVQNQISKDVRNLVDELPPDQKEVVILRHYIGMSFKEIADFTNVSINTALGRMRYALINLRKLIKEKNICLSVQ